MMIKTTKATKKKTASSHNLTSTYLRLRQDLSAELLPLHEQFWPQLIAGEYGDFHGEYMVSLLNFDSDWPTWEIHPHGDELVCLLSGAADMLLETQEGIITSRLEKPGDFILVPQNTWHTANITRVTSALFITPGEGTKNRER